MPVVVTEDLAAILVPLLARSENGTPSSTSTGPSSGPAGSSSPSDRMAVRMSTITGRKEQSCLREIGKILYGEKPTTNANRADAALLALDNVTALSTLTLLFVDRLEALDAAAIYEEFNGGDPDNADRLGVSLWHFSQGFAAALETDEQRARRKKANTKKVVPDDQRIRRRPQTTRVLVTA